MSILKSIWNFFIGLFSKNNDSDTEVVEPDDNVADNETEETPNETGKEETAPEEDKTVDSSTGSEVTEEPATPEVTEPGESKKDETATEDSSNNLSSTTPDSYKNVVVFLDNGHTDKTPGKCSPDKSLYEWKYNREIVKRIETKLDELGIEHWNSHPEDSWVDSTNTTDSKDLILRCKRINAKYTEVVNEGKKAFLISVHVNAAGNGEWMSATGWECYTTQGQNNSDKLADCLYDAAEEILTPLGKKIRTDTSDGDRDYEANFYILKNSNCACTLTENFFMDNKSDVEWLLSEYGMQALTDLHIKGIQNWIDKYAS